jgi:hypothetical protein
MKPTLRYFLHFFLLLAAMTGVAHAQAADGGKFPVPYGPSNLGKEFVWSFPTNYEDPSASSQYIRLYITSPTRTRVQIYTGTVLKKTVYTIPNDIISFDLTKFEAQALSRSTYDPVPDDKIYRKHAVRVIADEPIVVYGMNRTSYTSDGMLILPVNALGTDYVVAAARDYLTGGFFRDILPSQFVVTAAFDNTNVTIETPMETPNHREGQIYSLQLSKGDVFSSMSFGPGGDLTGAVISASKPVAVTAGQNCTYLPDQRYAACDHIEEMLFPISTWGTVYHSVPFATRLKGDLFRIFAAEDGTDVYINGVLKFNLVRRGGPEGYGWIEYLPPNREILEFSSNKPIMVAQYNNSQNYDNVLSDPFYMVLTPVEQYQTQIVFTTPKPGDFAQNFMTVVADSAGYGQIEISRTGTDDQWENLQQKIPRAVKTFVSTVNGRRYVGVTFDIAAGAYKMRGPLPFAAYVYGFDRYDSYGYPLSAALSEIRSVDKDSPVIDKTVDCSGTVKAAVLDMPDPPIRSNLSSIDLIKGSFNYRIDVEPFEEGVAPGASYKLTVIDRALDARAIVQIYDKAGNLTLDTVDYTAIDIVALPTPLPFGGFFTGESGTKTITLENRSKRQVKIVAIRLQKANVGFTLVDPTTGFTLDSAGTPGARKDVTIRFDATTAGRFIDSLGLEDECGFRNYAEVNANVGTPIIAVSDWDFGAWPITAPAKVDQIEITNVSTDGGVLTVKGVAQDINDKVTFTLPNGLPAFPFDLASGESKVLRVAFKPAAVQPYLDSIVFDHNAPQNPANDPTGILKGRGIQGSLVVTSYDWGRRRVASGPYDTVVTLTNVGTSDVTLRTPLVLNGDLRDFTVDESVVTNKVLGPNQSLEVPVSFNPRRTGDRQMTITFPHDPQQADPVISTLEGFGTVPSLVTEDMDFGTMEVGTTTPNTRLVRFRLTDVAIPDTIDQVTIVDWQLTGDVADFSFVRPTGDVILRRASGSQEFIDIQGSFIATAAGTRTARLTAITAAGDRVDATSTWTGIGTVKDPSIEGTDVSFGVLCATTRTLEASVTNTSQVDLVITDLALVNLPASFSIPTMTFPITLKPTESLAIPVTYTASGNGVFDGFINVTNNSTNSPVKQLRVQGASVEQIVDASVVLSADGPAGMAELSKEFDAAVRIDEQMNPAIPVTSLVVTMTYDPKMLIPSVDKLANAGGAYSGVTLASRPITTPGTLVVDVTSPTPFGPTGDLFTVPFAVLFHENLTRSVSAEITQSQAACLSFTTKPDAVDVVPICGLSVRLIEMTGESYALRQNTPNPFNPTTKITYSLGLDGPTKVLLTDATGKLVQVLLDQVQGPGTYEMTLDVTNLPSGLYYYTLQSSHWSETRSMIVQK